MADKSSRGPKTWPRAFHGMPRFSSKFFHSRACADIRRFSARAAPDHVDHPDSSWMNDLATTRKARATCSGFVRLSSRERHESSQANWPSSTASDGRQLRCASLKIAVICAANPRTYANARNQHDKPSSGHEVRGLRLSGARGITITAR
jgi:uncharacterized protein YfaT (DUF1175 family)